MSMNPRERFDFVPITERAPLKFPGDTRLVVWTIVNVEEWDYNKAMPRQILAAPGGNSPLPDLPNWSWHEYGMRVGFWRMKAALDRFNVKATLAINARVCETYPQVAQASHDAGWEFMGHSYVQGPIHKLDNQEEIIKKTQDICRKFTGKTPVGWLGPGLTQTFETPELLYKHGVRYVGDWVFDDDPIDVKTAQGDMVALPYTMELNDIPTMTVQHHESRYWTERVNDHFDRLYEESAERAKILAIAVHPYISGVPHRSKHFEAVYEYLSSKPGVEFWTGEQIYEWYQGQK